MVVVIMTGLGRIITVQVLVEQEVLWVVENITNLVQLIMEAAEAAVQQLALVPVVLELL